MKESRLTTLQPGVSSASRGLRPSIWGRYQIAANLLLPLAHSAELRAYHERRAECARPDDFQLPLGRTGDCVEDIGGAALSLVMQRHCHSRQAHDLSPS